MLSDTSGEYEISVTKYIHPGYIIFQFEIKNLLPNITMKDVSIELTTTEPPREFISKVKSSSIGYKEIGYCYSVMNYDPEDNSFPVSTFKAKMLFTIVEFDANTGAEEGSYDEEYALPDVTLSAKDYTTGKALTEEEFK